MQDMIPQPDEIRLSGYIVMTSSSLALLMNSYILVIFVYYHHKVKPYMGFVINLAMSDLCLAIYGVSIRGPGMLWKDFFTQSDFHMGLCLATAPYVTNIMAYASSVAVSLITYDRWYAICYPIQHRCAITKGKVLLILLTIWIIYSLWISMMTLLTNMGVLVNTFHTAFGRCAFTTTRKGETAIFVSYCLFFVVPFMVTVCLYIGILYTMTKTTSRTLGKDDSGSRQKAFIFISLLLVLFFISWFPHFVSSAVTYSGGKVPFGIKLGFFVLFYTNLFTDPFIYALNCPLVRSPIKNTLKRVNTKVSPLISSKIASASTPSTK